MGDGQAGLGHPPWGGGGVARLRCVDASANNGYPSYTFRGAPCGGV